MDQPPGSQEREFPETMSVESAARILSIGRTLAYRLARQGKLPGTLRLGHRYVVSRKILKDFIEGNPSSNP